MTDKIHAAEQAELDATEPMTYDVLVNSKHRGHVFGDKQLSIGLMTNSKAGGYADSEWVLIDDNEDRPDAFIENCIHEGLHAVFPELTELQVSRAGRQIGDFVTLMLEWKLGKKIPPLRPVQKLMAMPETTNTKG